MAKENRGQFQPGRRPSPATEIKPGQRLSPRTEFRRGEHTSPATEFVRGQRAHNKQPIGAVRTRIETHTGLPRAWVKVAEPNVWQKRAIVVWVATNGELPRGWVVHHKDRDSMNDSIDNLQAMTRAAHLEEHRHD